MAQRERRATMHAALSDPARLAVTDRLALADASPGELGAHLGLATNLMAHHLKVLQDAGLVRRVRSEADRRRSYVQLVLDDPLAVALTRPEGLPSMPHRVVFVCTHNSARSQLAVAAWQQVSDVAATSAGTHPADRIHPGAARAARRHGLSLKGSHPSRFRPGDVGPDDLLIAVCDNAYEALPGLGLLHWSVPDPVRLDTEAAFESAYRQISTRVQRLADALPRAA